MDEIDDFCVVVDISDTRSVSCIDINDEAVTEFWEIYEEPKKKVKMYKWAVQWHNRSYPEDTHHYYTNESEVPTGCKVIKRLDYTEIEVEVEG